MRTSLALVALTLGLVASSSLSHACAQEADSALTDEEARGLFEAGRSAYTAGRFEDALEHFQRAFELSDRPMLLFNIAQTLDRLRRDEEALSTFERFLELVPDAENHAQVESRMRILRETLARGAAHEGDATPGRRRPFAWITAGSALVFAGLAAGFWILGNGEYDDLKASCAPDCTNEEINASNLGAFDVLTNVSLALSVAAAATSVVLFVFEGRADEESLAISVSPLGLRLRGSF